MSSKERSVASPACPLGARTVAIRENAASTRFAPTMSPPAFRFAPSPNGELHLGHAYSALLNRSWRRLGGRLLLRIEDIDLTRCTPELEAAIMTTSPGSASGGRCRSAASPSISTTTRPRCAELSGRGLVYPAFMSRGEIRAHIADRGAAGTALAARSRRRAALSGPRQGPVASGSAGGASTPASPSPGGWMSRAPRPASATLSWQEAATSGSPPSRRSTRDPSAWGDVMLARKETPTSYHLSVVVDDAAAGRHPCRSRPRPLPGDGGPARCCRSCSGCPAPLYFHHRLIDGPDGRKLPKSRRDSGLAALRRQGVTPARFAAGSASRPSEAGQPGLDERQQGQRDE